MVDVSSISIGLTSLKTALDITKELRSIDSSLKDAEVKLKLAELLEALSEAKIQLSEVRDENQELKAQIANLEERLSISDEVRFDNGHYFLKFPTEGKASGPFCANCYSDSGKLVPVSELTKDFEELGKYRCPKCDSYTI